MLRDAESRLPTAATYNDRYRVRESLRQLRQGVPLSEGMTPRLWELSSSPGMRRFHFAAPGLAPLLRLREQLVAEQRAATAPPPAGAELKSFRYTGPPWEKVAGARRNTGDVIALSDEAARRWATVLELVAVAATQD